MMTVSQPSDLLDLLRQTHTLLGEFIDSRTPAQQTEAGQPQNWSARDLLTNIAFWMRYTVERIGFYARNEAAPQYVDFNALSLGAFEKGQHLAWEVVVAETHDAVAQLAETISRFPAPKLNTFNTYGNNEGGPLWGEIQANAFLYPLQELARFYTEHGEVTRATTVNHRLHRVKDDSGTADSSLPPRVSQDEVQSLPADVLVIDVRGPNEYASGHVPGAVNIPITTLLSSLHAIPSDQPVVTYCNMNHPGQSRGEHAARMLAAEGYQVRVLDGGLNQWKAKGLPLERGG